MSDTLRAKIEAILPPSIATERADAVISVIHKHLADPATVERMARFLARRDGFADHALSFAVGAVAEYTADAEAILAALTEDANFVV